MGYIFGGDTNQSQESITDARKRLAAAMLQQGTDTSPIQSPWEGAARMAQALMGGLAIRKQGEAEQAGMAEGMAALTGQPYTPPEKPAGFLSSILGGNKAANPGATGSSMPKVDASGNIPVTPSSGGLPGSFLAAVDKTEGAGGYDTLYGNAQKNGPFAGTDVTRMPIRDVIAFTHPSGPYAQSVKDQIGRVATPVGRYQVVGTTLRNAVGALGLDPNAPFDQNAQDAVGAYLARQRIASADSLPGQIAALRQEWHGFRNVPDEQLAQVVADLQSGGAAPVQVADANPSAGMPSASPIQPPPVNPSAPAPTPGYVDPMIAPNAASPMPPQSAPGEVASLDPSIGIPMPGAEGQMRATAPAQPMPPQGASQAALSPLPTSTVGPTPNVASVPPVSQIPPEFQGSQQLMNADPKQGILAAILGGGSPASPEQVSQAQSLGGQQQPAPARLAAALDGASPQQAANPMANPRAQALAKVLMNPNTPAPMKQMAAQSLQTLMKPPEFGFETLPDGTILRSDPRTGTVQPIYRSEMSQADQAKLKLEQDKLDYERGKPTEVNGRLVGPDGKVVADFGNGDWDKLENGSLFNKKTGEVRSAQSAGGPAGFRFNGNSVEAQSLNGLIDSKAITPEQAQQLGAGKTITGPNGEIIFMTPQGVFGSPAGGGTPQPLNAPQASQGAPIDLFSDGGGAAPADAPPVAPPAPVAAPPAATPPAGPEATPMTAPVPPAVQPVQAPAAPAPAVPAQRPGMIPLTQGKPDKPLTEAQQKNRSLYSVIKPELKTVEENFDALTDPKNQVFSKMPFSEFATTPEYQKAANSLQTIVSSYLYSVSGATATPDEVRKQTDILTPRPMEDKASVENKKQRIRTMVNAVAQSGGLPGEEAPAAPRPRATNPQTGETIEFDGTQWVPVK